MMQPQPRKVLVTGGAGFIGSALVRQLVLNQGHRVLNIDRLTYASVPEALQTVRDHPGYQFERRDIGDAPGLKGALEQFRPQAVLHLAAETHVDRSIQDPQAFLRTNILGTQTLLSAVLAYWQTLPTAEQADFRFLQVSTDEVYGDQSRARSPATEETRYAPSSPYAASKAGADFLVQAWQRTYGLPTLITHSANNYGPWHHPDKLIPLAITRILTGQTVPLFGDGRQRRNWLHVDDHVQALIRVLEHGRPGEHYNIASDETWPNRDVVQQIGNRLALHGPSRGEGAPDGNARVRFVPDRAGHDRSYAMSTRKIRRELGWAPQISFQQGLAQTIDWFLAHPDWWRARLGGKTPGGSDHPDANRTPTPAHS